MTLDTTIGRWLSEDPIGFRAADGNLYRYVGNDPTNLTDPSGLAPLEDGDVAKALLERRKEEKERTAMLGALVPPPSAYPSYQRLADAIDQWTRKDLHEKTPEFYLYLSGIGTRLVPGWKATQGVINSSIQDLGSDEFEAREAASARLKDLAIAALPQLQQAAQGEDAERRRRALEILDAPGVREIYIAYRLNGVLLSLPEKDRNEILDSITESIPPRYPADIVQAARKLSPKAVLEDALKWIPIVGSLAPK